MFLDHYRTPQTQKDESLLSIFTIFQVWKQKGLESISNYND